jgi:hypothetical protein
VEVVGADYGGGVRPAGGGSLRALLHVGGGSRRLARPLGQKAEWASWPLSWLGRKWKEKLFRNKNWIFEYTKALEICRWSLTRNFVMGIFPKFF